MKKLSLILIILFFTQSLCVFAQNNSFDNDSSKTAGNKKSFWIPDRTFEIGLANFNVNFSNNFLSAVDFFQEVMVIDLDKLADGFKLNLGANVKPFFFNINSKKGWGFGLSTEIEAMGLINLSGNMLTISEAVEDKSDLKGAVFASATVNTHFNLHKIKVKLNPSAFYTLAYVTPIPEMSASMLYTLDYSGGTVMNIDYATRIYTAFPLENFSFDNFSLENISNFMPSSKPGFDVSIGLEYPFAKEIGLSRILPFLDFDIGIDLINVSIVPSTMTDYVQIKGRVGRGDRPIALFSDDEEDDSLFSLDEIVYGKENIEISRPFKMLGRIDWRPLFGNKVLTITPVVGFSHNELYDDPFSWEAGLNACLNFGNMFLIKAGVNYTDRMFVNSLGFVLNFRIFEINLGADIRGEDFDQSWSGAGLGVNFGLKFGW